MVWPIQLWSDAEIQAAVNIDPWQGCIPASGLCPLDHAVVLCCGMSQLLLMLVLLIAEDMWNPSNLMLIVSGCN